MDKALPPLDSSAERPTGAKAAARRAVTLMTKRTWRLVRKALPTAVAEPLRVGVRSGLRTAGLLGRVENDASNEESPEAASAPGSPSASTTRQGASAAETMEPPELIDHKPLVFVHVMKCGGTSVRVALSMGLTGHREGPDIFELDGEAAKASAGGSNPDNWRFRDALLPYVLRAMAPTVVLGHFRYRDDYLDLVDSAHFVTVLRDPVERMVSLYKYRRYKDGIDVAFSDGFDEFIASRRWAKEGHAYVDTFCGNSDLDPRSEAAITAAVSNLRRFAVVGFTDRLDEFADRVSACVGRPVGMWLINESPAPETVEIESSDAFDRVQEICAPDLAVYERIRVSPVQ